LLKSVAARAGIYDDDAEAARWPGARSGAGDWVGIRQPKCPAGEQREIRFVGTGAPARGSTVFLACPGG
jgi:hypothetical protein